MPVVTMPDGVDVAFPDDMAPEQIKSLIQQKFPDAAAQVAGPELGLEVEQPGQAPESDDFSYQRLAPGNPLSGAGALLDLFGPEAVTRGSVEGATDLASLLPVIGPINQRVTEGALDYALPADEFTPRENLGRNVMRFGVGAAAPSAGMAAAAVRGAKPAATLLGRVAQKFMKPYEVNPGRAVQGDVAAGVGAGTATSGYEEYAPESVQESGWDPIARIFAALGGGVGGVTALSGARGALKTAGTGVKSRLGLDRETALPANEKTGELFKTDEVDEAARFVQEGASDPALAARTIDETIAGIGDNPLPTTGPLSNDVGMIQMEGGLRRRDAKPFIEQDRRVDTAASAKVSGMAPEGVTGRAFTDAPEIDKPAADLRAERGVGYKAGMEEIGQDATVLDLAPIEKAVDDAFGVQRFKDMSTSPSTAGVQQRIAEEVETWKGLDPNEYHTAAGLDALKQRLGDIMETTQPGTPEHVAASRVYNAVKDEIVKQAPEYGGVMQAYTEASEAIVKREAAFAAVTGKSPEKAVGSILGSGDPERSMTQVIEGLQGNEQAKLGLKAALVDHLVKTKTTSAVAKTTDNTRPVSFAKLDDLFKKNERVLAQVFSPEEMNNLRQVHKMLSVSKRDLQATTGSATAERQAADTAQTQALFPLEAALRLKFGMLKGGGIMALIKRSLRQMKGSETDNVEQLRRQMAFDPELAKHLLTRQVDVGGAAWNAKLNRLLAYKHGADAAREDEEVPSDQ